MILCSLWCELNVLIKNGYNKQIMYVEREFEARSYN
jgi:hypothetical protein